MYKANLMSSTVPERTLVLTRFAITSPPRRARDLLSGPCWDSRFRAPNPGARNDNFEIMISPLLLDHMNMS
jgi:hypothetical protein